MSETRLPAERQLDLSEEYARLNLAISLTGDAGRTEWVRAAQVDTLAALFSLYARLPGIDPRTVTVADLRAFMAEVRPAPPVMSEDPIDDRTVGPARRALGAPADIQPPGRVSRTRRRSREVVEGEFEDRLLRASLATAFARDDSCWRTDNGPFHPAEHDTGRAVDHAAEYAAGGGDALTHAGVLRRIGHRLLHLLDRVRAEIL